jgi:NodT family efflux transporter outer membrane factor (OMF) lipoprotein
MRSHKIILCLGIVLISTLFTACNVPKLVQKTENKTMPKSFAQSEDTTNTSRINWQEFFSDPYLVSLIDTALVNNQELNITLQEMVIARNEARARKGEYMPFVDFGAAAGVEKIGRYTSQGANDANTDISPGKEFPEFLPDFLVGAFASWEVDIWHKMRNARKSALLRYQATVEGKNFLVTNLVAEIAYSYYELMALDNQLVILKSNIEIQKNALAIIKQEKQAARVTELAVKRFEAEVLKNRSKQFFIQQKIIEAENRINFLVGRYPQPFLRSSTVFIDLVPDTLFAGIPSQLLENRPDVRQAEQELMAAKLDIKVARANFYPALRLSAGAGFQAFNPVYFIKSPQSMLFSLAGDLVAPLVNRNAIKAEYASANARQIQAVYNYERTLLTAYIEVVNQLSRIGNLEKSFDLQTQQVAALTESIKISSNLFKSAKADYMEVLLTQRDALESKMELVETKQEQLHSMVNLYQALGGGWR